MYRVVVFTAYTDAACLSMYICKLTITFLCFNMLTVSHERIKAFYQTKMHVPHTNAYNTHHVTVFSF